MIEILLGLLEFTVIVALFGLLFAYLNDEEDVDLSKLAAVLSTVYILHRIRKEKQRERQRQYIEFKNR